MTKIRRHGLGAAQDPKISMADVDLESLVLFAPVAPPPLPSGTAMDIPWAGMTLLPGRTWPVGEDHPPGDDSAASGLEKSRGQILGVAFADWPAAAGEPPLLSLLAWSLQEDGEEMELILAGLEAGRRLGALGISMLIGPTLSPAAWGGRPELTARASAIFLQGLSAAGLILCADDFPAASAEDVSEEYRAFPHAFAHGLDAVRLDASISDPARVRQASEVLRGDLGFQGVIVARAPAASEAPRFLLAGCDVIETADPREALEAIERARTDGKIEPSRLILAHRRVELVLAS